MTSIVDIKQIVNSKGSKAAAAAAAAAAANGSAQDLRLMHSISQANGMPMPDTGSERGNSPHDSENSRYSAPHYGQMNSMNGIPNPMQYPSPTAMQNPLPMLQQTYQPNNDYANNMVQQESQNPRPRQAADPTAQKAFPCSSCGKGFARRSDLARHGMIKSIMQCIGR